MENGRLSVYEIDSTPLSTTPVLAQRKLSWKIALPPDESLTSKDGTVLICVHCIAGTTSCVHEHISPLLGEHLCIVKKNLGPVTVHYREVSLYT